MKKHWIQTPLFIDLVILPAICFGFHGAPTTTRFSSSQKRQRQSSSIISMSTDDNNSHEHPQHVLIAGAGIIGLSTAFYLHKQFGLRTTIIDVTGTM